MTYVIGVHGFQYDPAGDDPDNDPWNKLYPLWRRMVVGEPPGDPYVDGFHGHGWYSAPLGARYVWRAWRAGYFNRYYHAWDLAVAEGRVLREVIRWHVKGGHGPVALVAHSLGSRVVLAALNTDDVEITECVARVLLLSGADSRAHALAVAPRLRCPVLNVVVHDDRVLGVAGRYGTPKIGAEPVIGRTGLRNLGLSGVPDLWYDLHLTEADDHWDAYEDRRYWPGYRAFLHEGILPQSIHPDRAAAINRHAGD